MHKILIPIVILIAAGAAAPLFLITSDVAGSCYTCTNPISVTNLTKHNPDLNDEKFVYDLYSTLVTVFTYALPVLILPLSICIGKYLREGIKKTKKCRIASFSTYLHNDWSFLGDGVVIDRIGNAVSDIRKFDLHTPEMEFSDIRKGISNPIRH